MTFSSPFPKWRAGDFACCVLMLLSALPDAHAAPQVLQPAAVLRVAVSQGTEPPFAGVDGQLTRGVLPDLYRELVVDTPYQLTFVELPRAQLGEQLRQGKADVFCHSSPRWLTEPSLSWSPALMRVRDMLVSRQPFADLATFEQQYQGLIGTVRGYNYVEINQTLLAVRRNDAPGPAEMLRAYAIGITDAAIVSEAMLRYYIETVDQPAIALYDNALHCAYAPSLAKTTQQILNDRISLLARRGKFELIYRGYIGKGQLRLD